MQEKLFMNVKTNYRICVDSVSSLSFISSDGRKGVLKWFIERCLVFKASNYINHFFTPFINSAKIVFYISCHFNLITNIVCLPQRWVESSVISIYSKLDRILSGRSLMKIRKRVGPKKEPTIAKENNQRQKFHRSLSRWNCKFIAPLFAMK